MVITGVTKEDIFQAAKEIGVEVYEFHSLSANRHRFQLRPDKGSKESRERYQRRSPSGRLVNAICWHGFRDFYCVIFANHPKCVVRTSMATYRGVEGFEQEYRATGDRNVGSAFCPVSYRETCDCQYVR